MPHSLLEWAPTIGAIGATGLAIFTVRKLWFEIHNLRRRDAKELLELIAEVERRLQREADNAWRYPNANLPQSPLEDSLAKDLLVSQIFGQTIAWAEWLEIRKFLMDHDLRPIRFRNMSPMDLLRHAWSYRYRDKRDKKKAAPRVRFRKMWRICLKSWWYTVVYWATFLWFLFWFELALISINRPFRDWLILNLPFLDWLWIPAGIQNNVLLAVGAALLGLIAFHLNFYFNLDGDMALLICKKTQTLAKKRLKRIRASNQRR
jgi:hypothetical protein